MSRRLMAVSPLLLLATASARGDTPAGGDYKCDACQVL
eukprot:gene30249-61219_t